MFEINCDYFPGFGEGTIICISNDNLHSQLIYTSSPWMAANIRGYQKKLPITDMIPPPSHDRLLP